MAVSLRDSKTDLMACAKGEQKAFQNLYLREAPHMLALCLKLLPQRAQAEDLLRETFVLIWKNADSFDPALSSARAWMYSILRYRALARLRQPGRNRPSDEPSWPEAIPDQADPTLLALAQLDETPRKALFMAYYGGYNYEQIAAELKQPAGTIKRAVCEGLQRISEHSPA